MIGPLWKIVYDLEIILPAVLLTTLLVPGINYPDVLFASAILIILTNSAFLDVCKNVLPKMNISIKHAAPNDSFFQSFIFYCLPIFSLLIDANFVLVLVIILMIGVVLILSNSDIPNILLRFWGYHYYKVETNEKISGYMLITKRDIEELDRVKSIVVVSKFLIFDLGE